MSFHWNVKIIVINLLIGCDVSAEQSLLYEEVDVGGCFFVNNILRGTFVGGGGG